MVQILFIPITARILSITHFYVLEIVDQLTNVELQINKYTFWKYGQKRTFLNYWIKCTQTQNCSKFSTKELSRMNLIIVE